MYGPTKDHFNAITAVEIPVSGYVHICFSFTKRIIL